MRRLIEDARGRGERFGSVSRLRLLVWIAAAQLVALALAGTFLWVRVFYQQDTNAVYFLSYFAADKPETPPAPLMVGVHTFGDFLLPFEQALVPNPWTDYPRWPQPYPSGLVTLFKALTLLPYTLALPIVLLACFVSMLVPMMSATKSLPAPLKVAAYCGLVILTAPFAIVIDRGNVQGLLVVPLFLFARAWRAGQWRTAAWALIAASVLKLYPLVLVVVFLAERRWKAASLTVLTTLTITLALFAVYPGSLGHTLAGFERGLTRFASPGATGIVRSNYSLVGMATNLISSLAGLRSPLLAAIGHWPWALGGAYLLLVSALLCAHRMPFIVRLSLALTLTSQIVPVSYGYSLVFIFVIVGELVREVVLEWNSSEDGNGIDALLAIPLTCAVVLTLAPNPIPLPNRLSSFATILVPASWLALALACAAWVLQERRNRSNSFFDDRYIPKTTT